MVGAALWWCEGVYTDHLFLVIRNAFSYFTPFLTVKVMQAACKRECCFSVSILELALVCNNFRKCQRFSQLTLRHLLEFMSCNFHPDGFALGG